MTSRSALPALLSVLAAVAPALAAPQPSPPRFITGVAGNFTALPGTLELNNGTNFTHGGFGSGRLDFFDAGEEAGSFTVPPGTLELNNGTNYTHGGFGPAARSWQGDDSSSGEDDSSGDDSSEEGSWEGSFEMNDPNRTVFPPRMAGECIEVEPVANFSTSMFDGAWVLTAGLDPRPCGAVHFSHLANGSLLLRFHEGTTDTSSTPTVTLLLSYSGAVATSQDGNSSRTQTVFQTDYTSYALVLLCDDDGSVFNTMALLTRDGVVTAATAAKVRSQKYGLDAGFLIGMLALNRGNNCTKTYPATGLI